MKRVRLFALMFSSMMLTNLVFLTPSVSFAADAPPLISKDINGDGTNESVYELDSADDFFWFMAQGSALNAELLQDIVVNDISVNESGEISGQYRTVDPKESFGGILNGNGHTLRGLVMTESATDSNGLIKNLTGTVRNLNITDSYFHSRVSDCGGICGISNKGTIEHCQVSDSYLEGSYVGAICSYNMGRISYCQSIHNYLVGSTVGGIAYYNAVTDRDTNTGIISYCTNTSDIIYGNVTTAGGICTYNHYHTYHDSSATYYYRGTITNCCNLGTIGKSNSTSAGICTTNYYGSISNCYNYGQIIGRTYTRKLTGVYGGTETVTPYPIADNTKNFQNTSWVQGPISNCYYLSSTGTDKNATSKTAAQFASGQVAYNLNSNRPNGVWKQKIGEDQYPVLNNDSSCSVYQCSNCQNVICYTNNAALQGQTGCHLFTKENTQAQNALFAESNCVSPALYFKSCTYCDLVSSDEADLFEYGNPLGHDMTAIPANEPTELEPGNYDYWICAHEDGVYYKDPEGIERFENYEATIIPELGKRVDVTFSHNVALNNNLGIIYYIPADKLEGFENVRLVIQKETFNSDGSIRTLKEETLSSFTLEDSGHGDEYVFSYRNIAAKEMISNIYARLFAEKDGETYHSSLDEYSIVKYATKKLDLYRNSTTKAALKTLLVDMLNYGAAAQTYFNYNTSNLANSVLDEEQKALATPIDTLEFQSDYSEIETKDAKASFSGKNLLLGNNVAVVYYMTFDDSVDKKNVTLELTYQPVVGDKIVKTVPFKSFVDGDYANEYRYDFIGVQAKDSCQPIETKLFENGTLISNVMTYSIETYAVNKLGNTSTSQKLRTIIGMMMAYCKSAENYFNT